MPIITNTVITNTVVTDTGLGDLAEDADAALRQLYDRYAKPLHSYVERFGPDLASTDDIVQETFIRAWRTCRSSPPTTSWSGPGCSGWRAIC